MKDALTDNVHSASAFDAGAEPEEPRQPQPPRTLREYVESGSMTRRWSDSLSEAVAEQKNILIVGETDSGKTVLMNALLHEVTRNSPKETILCVEDTEELRLQTPHAVRVSVRDACQSLWSMLSMKKPWPRVVVGACRTAAAQPMCHVWQMGEAGGFATIHAGTAGEGLRMLSRRVGEGAGMPEPHLVGGAVDIVVVVEKRAGKYTVRSVARSFGYDGRDDDEGFVLVEIE